MTEQMNNDIIGKVLNVSEKLGPGRSIGFVMAKLMEEYGEFGAEINIALGNMDPAKGGDDGIIGEACDVINCVVDLVYLIEKFKNPMFTKEQLFDMMQQRQEQKCEKWVRLANVKKE